MLVGMAQYEITPKPGAELQGFAVRVQPSCYVADPLYLKGLYLDENGQRLLWFFADLIGFNNDFVREVKKAVSEQCNIPENHIQITATHTHSGPGTTSLSYCGEYDAEYIETLKPVFSSVALDAVSNAEPCAAFFGKGHCDLAFDRRASDLIQPCVDTVLPVLAWKRPDGTFKAVLVSYGMHPVSLCTSGISADWPGTAAKRVSDRLPGNPVVCIGSGASGNINTPTVHVAYEQMQDWAGRIAHAAAETIKRDLVYEEEATLDIRTSFVPIDIAEKTVIEVVAYAEAVRNNQDAFAEFKDQFLAATDYWKKMSIGHIEKCQGKMPGLMVEINVVRIGPFLFVLLNAEIFAHFTFALRQRFGPSIFVMGHSNGTVGYIAPESAYDEGGYETEWAPLFYGLPRPLKGSFEKLLGKIEAEQ